MSTAVLIVIAVLLLGSGRIFRREGVLFSVCAGVSRGFGLRSGF
jgi:hypothetical protein